MKLILRALVFGISSIAVSLCLAQQNNSSNRIERPNFTGKWTLDKTRSKARREDFLNEIEIVLLISHQEPEIKVTRRAFGAGEERQQEYSYFTDGRRQTIPTLTEGFTSQCKTKWDKLKVVSECTDKGKILIRNVEHTMEQDLTEKWDLSPDGKTLTQKTSFGRARFSGGLQLVPPSLERDIQASDMLNTSENKMVFQRTP